MRGRIGTLVFATLAMVTIGPTLSAQNSAPPAGEPSRPAMNSLVHPFPVGPTDVLDRGRPVFGKVTMFARPPREVAITSAEFFVDGKSVGKAAEQPYKLEYETSGLTNGEHVVKAVGLDAQGKEVWAASAKAVTGTTPSPGVNAMPPAGERSNPPHPVPGEPMTGEVPPNVSTQPGRHNDHSAVPPTVEQSDAPAPMTGTGTSLTRTYSNSALSFSISYPQAWTAVDKTEDMKPKQAGNSWIVFGTEPLDKSGVVVNLKRTQLEADSSVDTFAKYNSYVKDWKRTALLGSSAFVTTDGKPENKRVIHRAIIIKDGCAWMLNCIDTTGKPVADSKKIFDSMINTLSTLKPVQPTVTITESRSIR